ncbi:MAG: L,D-transpeptidase family protein [Proteobacteria bacterium]|nr:L,D-transpeptidase family protein [Pseudomonadota bacterium]
MIKQSALRLVGISVLGVFWAGNIPVAMAEPTTAESSSGTTTYFAPSNAPATTAAIPKPSDPPKTVLPDAAAVPPKASPPASTAAVAPATQQAPTADSKPADTPSTTTAVVAPAADNGSAPQSPATDLSAATAPDAKPADASSAPPVQDTAQQPKPAETTPAVAAPQPPPVSPIVEAARAKLSDKSLVGRSNTSDDVAAARDYYDTHTEPLWLKDGAFTHKAKEVIETLRTADDWGLESSDFVIPPVGSGASAEGSAEAQLTLSALKYARFARGGRLDPVSLSNILDLKPPVKDAKSVMRELASASAPGAFLRGLNPKHIGFERLRQALLKARGGRQEEDEQVDPALLVKLPNGKLLKRGVKDDQVSLLRQRLKIPANDPANDRVYDDQLAAAVRDIQRDNGLKANGVLSNRVRAVLNKAGQPKKVDSSRYIDRLIVNMERWRWLPANLGPFYVMNNIPEFTSEIWKDNRIELKQKIIVGQAAWPTPLLAAKMQYVIFHPSWGMPDGIKAKELAPRLRRASSTGFGFFDQLFGNVGGNGGAEVLQAYKLQVYYNGHQIDPDSINWNTADLRQYSFIQPPGPDNPLGLVKFRFPNKHDVYMHDTPERGLFGQTFRALSHGCMRVEEPRRTAEVILAEDKGYSQDKVGQLWDSGASVTLSKEVPVYLVYFTARIGDDGQLDTYQDIYGIDDRVMSALRGHPVRFVAQEAIDPTEAAEPGGAPSASNDAYFNDAGSDDLQDAPPSRKTNRSNKNSASAKKSGSTGNAIQDALSNIFLN